MIEASTAYLLGMLLLALPIFLIGGEDTGIRDCCIILLVYPLWLIPIIIFFIILFIYCFIFNKTADEGFNDFEIKLNKWRIFIEGLMKR